MGLIDSDPFINYYLSIKWVPNGLTSGNSLNNWVYLTIQNNKKYSQQNQNIQKIDTPKTSKMIKISHLNLQNNQNNINLQID